MIVPMPARIVAAVIGGLLLLTCAGSVIGTLIVSRSVSGRLMRWVDRAVDATYQLMIKGIGEYKRRDQLLATQAATLLMAQLVTWLLVIFVGYGFVLWPFVTVALQQSTSDRTALD